MNVRHLVQVSHREQIALGNFRQTLLNLAAKLALDQALWELPEPVPRTKFGAEMSLRQ